MRFDLIYEDAWAFLFLVNKGLLLYNNMDVARPILGFRTYIEYRPFRGLGNQEKALIVLLGSGNYTGGAGRDWLANASKYHRP